MHTKKLTKIALMSALLCIMAPISIPIPVSPVALTLATFALYLIAYILPPKEAVAAVGLYLLMGSIGIPVFSGFTAGISRFASPGGGYLIGYLFLASIGSVFIRRYPAKPMLQIAGLFLATLVAYSIGTFWMGYVTGTGFFASLTMGALVFLPLDCVKILLASYLGRRLLLYLHMQS